MEAFLDGLVAFLASTVPWRSPDTGQPITWIWGDWQSVNESTLQLPIGIVTPGVDQIKSLGGGVHGNDDHTYTLPVWIVNAIEQNAVPVATTGTTPTTYESPDARTLLRATESVIATLRTSLTAADAALINVPKAEYGRLPMEGGSTYRAARFLVVAQQRVAR